MFAPARSILGGRTQLVRYCRKSSATVPPLAVVLFQPTSQA